MTNIADQLNVYVIQSLLLARDSLGQDVVDEPDKVDVFLLWTLFFLFIFWLRGVIWVTIGIFFGLLCSSLLLSFRDDELLDSLFVLCKVILASVVALELDLIDDIL